VARSICLMGIGNVLMGDDALGPYLIESLQASWVFSPEVTVLDAGTPGLDLTAFLDGFDALVAVDALQARGEPGEVRTYRREDLLAGPLPATRSAHDPPLREALLRLELLGRGPRETFLVGAIAGRVATGMGLSEAVRRAVPAVEEQVLRELLRLDAWIAPRAGGAPAMPWWEAPASRG